MLKEETLDVVKRRHEKQKHKKSHTHSNNSCKFAFNALHRDRINDKDDIET